MTAILAIETSCDETAAAVIADGTTIKSNIVASQIDLHAQYGGIFPEVASRAHAEAISAVVGGAMAEANMNYADLDAIAVTQGPGLIGSLLVGVNFAKGLALATGLPLLGINHLEGHIYSLWLSPGFKDVEFPILALIASGGHSELVLMAAHGVYRRLGATIDDAAGEAFDKVGRLLGLAFPGGPAIESAAASGNPRAYAFPRARTQGPYDFSFSGLKTAVLREATAPPSGGVRSKRERRAEKRAPLRPDINISDLAAAFQEALTDALLATTCRAARDFDVKAIILTGGVSANGSLRRKFETAVDLPVYFPPRSLCTDNAAMIGAAAHFRFLTGYRSSLGFEARASWPLTESSYAGAMPA